MVKIFFLLLSILAFSAFGQKEYYELRKYELPFNSSEAALHDYLSLASFPALNRQEIKNIGVFEALAKDKTYLKKREAYDAISVNKKVYNRFTSSFLLAFDGIPILIKPKSDTNLFEFRTYEGYSEDAVRRKVKMFNEEELPIFEATGLHSLFFGEQLSGPLMPALTYLLGFKSIEERDTNWEKFLVHPEWKRISVSKEYDNTVSDIKRTFLKPLTYSQL